MKKKIANTKHFTYAEISAYNQGYADGYQAGYQAGEIDTRFTIHNNVLAQKEHDENAKKQKYQGE